MLSNTSVASSQTINVYLKLKPDNQVSELIKEFNQFLEEKKIFSIYQITPYQDQNPLHVTLYMTQYNTTQIPKIIKQAGNIAKQYKQIQLLTSRFVPERSGYVMLSVTNDAQIQALSNKTLNALAPLRDKKAQIPNWAAHDVARKLVFNQYGSPSVLSFFNPHFSIFSADHLKAYDSTRLYQELQKLIRQFDDAHQTQVRATIDAIGVGIVNPQGQVEKELKSFPLL